MSANTAADDSASTPTRRAACQDVLDTPAHRVAEMFDGTLYKAPKRWGRIGGCARKAAGALLLAACAAAHGAGADQGREETAAARIEALEPHHLSMHTQFYVESIERIIEIVGEELMTLSAPAEK